MQYEIECARVAARNNCFYLYDEVKLIEQVWDTLFCNFILRGGVSSLKLP